MWVECINAGCKLGWTTSRFSQFILNQIKDSLGSAFLNKALSYTMVNEIELGEIITDEH